MRIKKVKNKILLFTSFMSLLVACGNGDKGELIQTSKLDESVFIEQFYKSYGVYGGGTGKYYVTDSVNYRVEIGECDDKEYITYNLNGSILIVRKYSRRNMKNGKSKMVSEETFDLDKISK